MGLGQYRISEFGAPVLAICGYSGSGKTTLLETAIPKLVERGLAVAVVKHDAHSFEVDKRGKDSDRLFRAGATVALSCPQQQFERRSDDKMLSLESTLARLARDHDLLLVEGHKDIPLPKLWLRSADGAEAPPNVTNIALSLAWNSDRLSTFMAYIGEWLPSAWNVRSLYAGLLMGGMSSRMGTPKQLLQFGGQALGEIAAAALMVVAGPDNTVVLGNGSSPDSLPQMLRLPDSPGFSGPASALIAAHRWAPEAAWIVAACDHPWLRSKHLSWLAAQRQPGRWAIIPRQMDGHPCPTVALYEPQALEVLERLTYADAKHNARPLALLEHPCTIVMEPPCELADGWKNVNTPGELRLEEDRLADIFRRTES